MPAKIDHEKCEGCADCVDTCSVSAIKMEDEKAVVDEEACIDCHACESECQQQAIEIET
jgi:ferredoxin